jgi:hypothetical protein
MCVDVYFRRFFYRRFIWPTGVNCNAITLYLILLFVANSRRFKAYSRRLLADGN